MHRSKIVTRLGSLLFGALSALPLAQADVFPLPGGGVCDPTKQSCAPGTLPPTQPGGPTCGPGAGGATCPAPGPATQGAGGLNLGAGNPINVINANKYQREEDLPALPGVLGLELVRHYNSAFSGLRHSIGILGRGWKLSYETELHTDGRTVQIIEADGHRVILSADQADPSRCASDDPADGVVRVGKGAAGMEYTWEWNDGRKLLFNTKGKLTRITAATGEKVELAYNRRGMLAEVVDPQNRRLRIAYREPAGGEEGDAFRGVDSIATPVGTFSYRHGSPAPAGLTVMPEMLLANLVGVTAPSMAAPGAKVSGQGVTRRYHYEDARFPTLLSGISVEGAGNDGRVIKRRIATYLYDSAGKGVLSVRGEPARLRTDVAGKVVQPAALVPGTGIEQVVFDHSVGGQTTVTNALGERTLFRHTTIGGQYRLLEVRGPGCAGCGETNMRYDYDAQGRMRGATRLDAQGTPLLSELTDYDAQGRLAQRSRVTYLQGKPGPAQWLERREYEGLARIPAMVARPSVIAGRESQVRIAHNALGQVLATTESGWSPAAAGKLGAIAISRTTRYGYSVRNGRSVLTSIDGPLPNGPAASPADSDVTLFEYDADASFVVRTVAPGNIVTEVRARDAALRPSRSVSADGLRMVQVDTAYAPGGMILERHEQAWLVDSRRMARADTRMANDFDYRYDALGNVTLEREPERTFNRLAYDYAGRLSHRILPDDSQEAWSYDAEGRLAARALYGPQARSGSFQLYRYQAGGLAQVDQAYLAGPGAGDVERVYASRRAAAPGDPTGIRLARSVGNPGSIAERFVEVALRADGSTVRRWMDDFGRVVALASPERGLQVAQYSSGDVMTGLVDAAGTSVEIARDVQGRPLAVRYIERTGNVKEETRFRYAGVMLQEETRLLNGQVDSRIVWDSDVWGRSSGKRLHIAPDSAGDKEVIMQVHNYVDAQRRTLRKTLPSGNVVEYVHDASGKNVAITVNGAPIVSQVRYRQVRRGLKIESFDYGSGLRTVTGFNADGVVAAHASGTDVFTVHTDNEARVSGVERRPALTLAAPEGLLAQANGVWLSLFSSAKAADGRATPGGGSAALRQYGYDGAGRLATERLGESSRLAGTYDAMGNRDTARGPRDAGGNLTEVDGKTLSYGISGRLEQVRDPVREVQARYRYDPQGMRMAKRVGQARRYFLYEDGQLVAEAGADGRVLAEYVYLGRRPVGRLRAVADAPGGIAIEYLHTDARDAVTSVSNARRRVVWSGELDAFGSFSARSGSRGDMPLRLSGQYDDEESGLYFNVHRYYHAGLGRYLQPDPLGLAAGQNFYAYVNNNPLAETDALGLDIDFDEFRPWLFGTAVHSAFASQVRLRMADWGANDGRYGTWTGLRPDAYYAPGTGAGMKDPPKFVGTLWELKPISWSQAVNPSKYKMALTEVAAYTGGSQRGCWTPGSSRAMATSVVPFDMMFGGDAYRIGFEADGVDASGLLFYSSAKYEKKKQPVPAVVPAPNLSEEEKEKLKKGVKEVQTGLEEEGLSTLAVIGWIVLIAAAIALAIYFGVAATIISAVLATLRIALALAKQARPLTQTLAAMLGLSAPALAKVEQTGAQKQAGLLDSTINWFKSWF